MSSGAIKPFLHIHIRKTAGTSLRAMLANLFPVDRLLFNAHAVKAPDMPGAALFVSGHVDYDYAKRFSTWPTIFTLVREPIALALSTFYFFLSNDEAFFRALAPDWAESEYRSRRRFTDRARQLGLGRFLVEERQLARTWLSNMQTRQMAGISCAGSEYDAPQLLECAEANLQNCDLVGIFERLDETLALLGPLLHMDRLGPVQHVNGTARRADVTPPDANCMEILGSWNILDARLYQQALGLFEQKLRTSAKARLEVNASPAELLADGAGFTPDQPIRGFGWHERECHRQKWLCWTAAPVATLDLQLTTPTATRFRCFLSHVISRTALDDLKISLNSVQLALKMRPKSEGFLLEGPIPKPAWEADPHRARVTIDCPIMKRPIDVNPNSTDLRNLGVAVEWIRID